MCLQIDQEITKIKDKKQIEKFDYIKIIFTILPFTL